MKKIELESRSIEQDHMRIGLFFLPDNKSTPYVTWLINDQFNPPATVLGHYFTHLIPAVEDFQERK